MRPLAGGKHRVAGRANTVQHNRRGRATGQPAGRDRGDGQPTDAEHHQPVDHQPGAGRPAVHRVLRAVHGRRLHAAVLAVRRRLVQNGPVPDRGHGVRERLHAGAHVAGQVPGGRPPDRVHIRAYRAQRVVRHHRHVGADRAARPARARQTRRGHVHILQRRAHRVHIPRPGPQPPTGRLQQTGLPGICIKQQVSIYCVMTACGRVRRRKPNVFFYSMYGKSIGSVETLYPPPPPTPFG